MNMFALLSSLPNRHHHQGPGQSTPDSYMPNTSDGHHYLLEALSQKLFPVHLPLCLVYQYLPLILYPNHL